MQVDEDFYQRVVAITDKYANTDYPLEQYLRSLLNVFHLHAKRTEFETTEFLDILIQAFKYPPQAFDHMWHMIEESRHSPACYEDVVGTLKRQVAEIRSFRDEDVATAQIYLENGGCLNNFAVSTYLECAAAGAVDNSRIRPRPGAPLTIDWTDIRFFLGLGQSYE